jgi:hypothetical protein
MSSNLRRLTVCAMLTAGALVLLGGCEDQQARVEAANAAKEIAVLKGQLAEATAKAENVLKEMKALQEKLQADLDQKLDGLGKQAVNNVNDEVERLKAEYKKNLAIAETNAAENERKRMAAKAVDNKPEIMETIRLLREEVTKNNELMQKYMDNQLKELYPYAYQPRRIDPSEVPGAAVK